MSFLYHPGFRAAACVSSFQRWEVWGFHHFYKVIGPFGLLSKQSVISKLGHYRGLAFQYLHIYNFVTQLIRQHGTIHSFTPFELLLKSGYSRRLVKILLHAEEGSEE